MKRLVVSEPGGVLQVEETAVAGQMEEQVVEIGLKEKALAYLALTKPRIIELLLVTTVPSMIVAAGGWPPTSLVLFTVLGGALAAGGANAINCYIDRDIDRVMHRTRKRPLPTHRIQPRKALLFGCALGTVAFALLWATVNLPAALLAVGALLFYVFVYTLGLKRNTPQNIVIGGAAGAVPALVGWAAVTGTVEPPALALFGIIFYWTPPHFWALSMRYENEYAAAGVPMMPVVYGRDETAKHIVLYSILLFAMCMIFFSVAQMGVIFLAAALVLNGIFVGQSLRLRARPATRAAWGLFRFSIYYLALLFGAMAADRLIPI